MMNRLSSILFAILLLETAFLGSNSVAQETPAANESQFLTKVRQLTFDGLRAGEGYFSADGKTMVFQSERDPANPFYQIYLMDRETGDVERISPGFGKTTCAWVHPDNQRVLFASTQFDPMALDKQKAEIDFRASGQTRRYSWDYDQTYDLVEFDRKSKTYKQLTHALGYDAEGSYSPDGTLIAFASNRRAYSGELSESEKKLFETDPASAMDIYVMKSDGSDLKRITDVVGYDGGPFFSPDGKKLCWRRFSEDGARAEIYTANVDGTEAKALTNLKAMSWAPFFHPSGDYVIFATNVHGFANFELYAVDSMGSKEPVRITTTDGFDGLPVFTPDGQSLTWTSTRTADKKSQIFIAQWDDAAVRKGLGLSPAAPATASSDAEARSIAMANQSTSSKDFSAADVGRHVDYLCRPELGGRLTGTDGEKLATAYVAAYMESLGLVPEVSDGGQTAIATSDLSDKTLVPKIQPEASVDGSGDKSFFQPFPFTAGIDLGTDNILKINGVASKLDEQWRPISFSRVGAIPETDVVFAGYGLVAPKDGEHSEYDSYVHLDVEGKWVLVLRQLPANVSPERRQHLARYGSLRRKAMVARERGAVGLIVVSGPASQVRQQLVPLQSDGALSGSSLGAISIDDATAIEWLKTAEEDLLAIQNELDKGELMMGIPLPKVRVEATIDIDQIKKEGRNVLGRLMAGAEPSKSVLIVGAHIDHLGTGGGGNSLARDEERGQAHRGADDNASGVAAMLEIAQYMTLQKKAGTLDLKHDVIFAAWSGEELGLIGSSYYADHFVTNASTKEQPPSKDQAKASATPAGPTSTATLYPDIIACLNLDMVGRLREKLALQGTGSSTVWAQEIERRNAVVGLDVSLQSDSYLPTDASTFFLKGVPILSAFTGQHSEYHTPRDTPELLNYEGAASTAKLMGLIAKSLATTEGAPPFVSQEAPENQGTRAAMTAYLGTIPDYIQGDIKGVLLSGVAEKGPAAAAGVRAKDIIIELSGRKIENIYDYTYAIEGLKVGSETEIVVKRADEEIRMKITPLSRN
jgi:Tol biopolymer transport system component